MKSAVDQTFFHPEMISGGQHFVAGRADEAIQVVNQIPYAHHQLRSQNPKVAPGAPLYRVTPARERAVCQ